MPTQYIVYTEEEVRDYFTSRGVDAVITSVRDDLCDGNVEVGEDVYVQVGEGYLSLSYKKSERAIVTLCDSPYVANIYQAYEAFDKERRHNA